MSPTTIAASKFVPYYYAADALTWLFLSGLLVSSLTILPDLTVVSATSIAILMVWMLVFRK